MATPKPILELSTLRERKRFITIDGHEYTLHDPASMGVQQHSVVFHAAAQFREMGTIDAEEISPEEADQMLDLVTDATMQVVDAPRDVMTKLTVPQMMQIIDVFISSAGLANPPAKQPKTQETGAKSSPPSKGSTAEA
jgi:hypothetical protein